MSPTSQNGSLTNKKKQNESWIDAELLKHVFDQDAIILHIDAERATGKGDNYLSVIYRVRVESRLPETEEVHVKNVIIKGLPSGEYMLELIDDLNIFRRETTIYSEVLPKLYAFADCRLGRNSFKKISAAYHKTDRPDTLILDDLKPEGFVMASRRDRLDFSHAKLVVHGIAHLHALSIAYSEMNPDFFAPFEEFIFCDSNRERVELFMTPTLKEITEEVKKWEGFGEIVKKLEGLHNTLMDKVIEASTVPKKFQNILIHGDCWVNNLLFKYSGAGEPVDLRFVDLQMSRKSSPAIELLYFFFSSLQNDVRKFRYDDLLHEYYNDLSHSAEELGYTGQLFTFEELSLEMRRAAPFGFYAAVGILPIVLADPDDSPDLDSLSPDKEDITLFGKVYETPQFREAFEDLLPYFDKLGVFD